MIKKRRKKKRLKQYLRKSRQTDTFRKKRSPLLQRSPVFTLILKKINSLNLSMKMLIPHHRIKTTTFSMTTSKKKN
jgi:hypothetical protein